MANALSTTMSSSFNPGLSLRQSLAQSVQSISSIPVSPVIQPHSDVALNPSTSVSVTQIDRVSISAEAIAAAQRIEQQATRNVTPSEVEGSEAVSERITTNDTTEGVDEAVQASEIERGSAEEATEASEVDVEQIKNEMRDKVEKHIEQKQQQLELEQVQTLKARDLEVRNHEQAHAAIGGKHAGQPEYTFTKGPDGVNYATEGEVSIDVAPIQGNPEATLAKMQTVRAAALAPAEPSGQDRQVAAEADRIAAQARQELSQQDNEDESSGHDSGSAASSAKSGESAVTTRTRGVHAQSVESLQDSAHHDVQAANIANISENYRSNAAATESHSALDIVV